jgi:hypothetical protein
MPPCPGCGEVFSYTGYARHLSQTSSNAACREIYEDLLGFEASSDGFLESPAMELDEPAQFQGDYFGSGDTYLSDNFNWHAKDDVECDATGEEPGKGCGNKGGLHIGIGSGGREHGEDGNEDADEDDEDDDDLLAGEFEGGWEPEVGPDATSAAELDGPVEEATTEQNPATVSQQARLAAEEQLDSQPTVVKFPYGQAGAPTGHAAFTGHHAYKNQMQNSESCWAPFTSKMDWEVARWAKLRGPGSTAFDDLLQIEGVSLLQITIIMLMY